MVTRSENRSILVVFLLSHHERKVLDRVRIFLKSKVIPMNPSLKRSKIFNSVRGCVSESTFTHLSY